MLPDDFEVEEVLGFEPTGKGEHVLLNIEKRGLNTMDALRSIRKFTGAAGSDLGYCGLKDKNAVTRQWISVRGVAAEKIDWTTLGSSQLRVLRWERHNRKLRRGAHFGNRFKITVRNVRSFGVSIESRLEVVERRGIPNFFGPQRFGHSNLRDAQALFADRLKRMSRFRRGLLFSAARSQIFNDVLRQRAKHDAWDTLLPGDLAVLDGCNSFFPVDTVTVDLVSRLHEFDIHPSGPLFGAGESLTSRMPAKIEAQVRASHSHLCSGLIENGLRMARRPLRARVMELDWSWHAQSDLRLKFMLRKGSFATALLEYLGCEGEHAL